jgi:hypothetical protein
MCNYSLKFFQTRKAMTGETLTSRRSSDPDEPSYLVGSDNVVVCLQRGTELAFDGPVDVMGISFKLESPKSTLATFTKGDMLHLRPKDSCRLVGARANRKGSATAGRTRDMRRT